jgi:dienelactone hydrolase
MMHTETLEYQADGANFLGLLAYNSHHSAQEKCPGILVVHEAWGLDDHVKERAARLVQLGYVALAVDTRGVPGVAYSR